MKIWSISFTGVYPVGSAAIVCTRDDETEAEACEDFRTTWKDSHPSCNPEPVMARLLDIKPGTVVILHDGNY